MKEKIYFNFPIILLKDFLSDTKKVMDEIMEYALFNHTNTLRLGSEEDKIEAAYRFFGVTPGDKKLILGKKLVNSIGFKTPKVGINRDICFDFYENHKTSDLSQFLFVEHDNYIFYFPYYIIIVSNLYIIVIVLLMEYELSNAF